MQKVALVRCSDYEPTHVYQAIKRAIDLIGGIHQFVTDDEHILLKPNLVAADPPERCSTTHPAILEAMIQLLQEENVHVTYGDSPAFHSPQSAAKKCGLASVADKYDVALADFVHDEEVFFEEALLNKKFRIAKGILEADGVISLPKFKTHGMQKMTGCIKNQFGCVPGPLKGEMHVKLPDANDFAKMLVDLNSFVKPRLYVMDGIMAMEGNGPRGGSPSKMQLLMVSSDPVALDATMCRMIDLDPALVPTTILGQEIGMGTYDTNKIELVGDPIDDFIRPSFEVDRHPIKPFRYGRLAKISNLLFVPKPKINEHKCVKCGVCVLMCPVEGKAVNWSEAGKKVAPIYDYDKCIRCYCCQELCPESAIDLSVPPIRRLIDRRQWSK